MEEEQQSYRPHDHEIEKNTLKRKLEVVVQEEETTSLAREKHISEKVTVLNSTFSWSVSDRAAAKQATYVIADLANKSEENVNAIIDCNAIPAQSAPSPLPSSGDDAGNYEKPFEHEVEKLCANALGLLASKPEHQQLIVDSGALPHLVDLLKRRCECGCNSWAVNDVIRRAAEAISSLAYDNDGIKISVRTQGGIPPLVDLLQYPDTKVQEAAAGALKTLAFKNYEIKKQIVECNALPVLVSMLQSDDTGIHNEAVGAIGNLVRKSPDIKKQVLLAGALQPVIGLLRSCCSESQKEAARLIGQFASTDSDCKGHIVQRGALQPLIAMLESTDLQLQEMSSFALGRLAQDTHNQAGIVYNGGLLPLLKLLDSEKGPVQLHAAFSLYGLADNEDNVSEFIKLGVVQKLQGRGFVSKMRLQATKDFIAKTLIRLEKKIHGKKERHTTMESDYHSNPCVENNSIATPILAFRTQESRKSGSQVSDLEAKISSLQDQVNRNKVEKAAVDGRVLNLEAENARLKDQVDKQREDMHARFQTLEKQVSDLTSQLVQQCSLGTGGGSSIEEEEQWMII